MLFRSRQGYWRSTGDVKRLEESEVVIGGTKLLEVSDGQGKREEETNNEVRRLQSCVSKVCDHDLRQHLTDNTTLCLVAGRDCGRKCIDAVGGVYWLGEVREGVHLFLSVLHYLSHLVVTTYE